MDDLSSSCLPMVLPPILEIRKYPDQCLRKVAREITDEEFASGEVEGCRLSEMGPALTTIMLESDGAGLAATQVGIGLRFWSVVFPDGPQAVFNPTFQGEGHASISEGCLSLPSIMAEIDRYEKVSVSGFNSKGERIHLETKGISAIAVQHETDHLNGILFIDHVKEDYANDIKIAIGVDGDVIESFIRNRRRIAWKTGGDMAVLSISPMFLKILTEGAKDRIVCFKRKATG